MGNCCPFFPGSDQGVIAFYYSLLRQWQTIKVEAFFNGEVLSNNTKPTKKLANQLILKTNFVVYQCRQACWWYRDRQKWRQITKASLSVRTKKTKDCGLWLAVSDCLLEMLLALQLSDSSKSTPDFTIFSYVVIRTLPTAQICRNSLLRVGLQPKCDPLYFVI